MSLISRVSSYQTSDGTLHSDYISAATHEAEIDIAGLIQTKAGIGESPNMTPRRLAKFVIENLEQFHGIVSGLKTKRVRANKSKKNSV